MKRLLTFLILACALAGLVPLETSLRSLRTKKAPESSDTAWVRYVMVGLGGFRGIISEILWVRADQLQQQGRYFELAQLADWITALDPRATKSWVFNSWNLAYNVSAMIPDYKARTHWVFKGIDLLEFKAIPANPLSAPLYYELGFNYQFKIGGTADPASDMYRLALAAKFQPPAKPPVVPADIPPASASLLSGLDYRVPASHAVYWAVLGLRYAKEGFEKESLRRMIHQNLLTVILDAGEFAGDLAAGRYAAKPAPSFFPHYLTEARETLSLYPEESRVYALSFSLLARRLREMGEDEFSRTAYDEYCRISAAAGKTPLSYGDILKPVQNQEANWKSGGHD